MNIPYAIQMINHFQEKYEVRPDYIERLKEVMGVKVAIIVDNSSSMNTIISTPHPHTRMNECLDVVKKSIGIVNCISPFGADIYFMNGDPSTRILMNVTSGEQFEQMLLPHHRNPFGYTPTLDTFIDVLKANRTFIDENGLLVILITDGVPVDNYGNERKLEFKNFMKNVLPTFEVKNKINNPGFAGKIYTSIVGCTDDDSVVSYLEEIDELSPRIDYTDDYETKANTIRKIQGRSYRYGVGDWILSFILGPLDPYFDSLNERRVSSTYKKQKDDCCCIIS